jgi:hypothetical protein
VNLFIDTNVFLSFFHLTSEDLEELRKLSALVSEKRVRLCLPEQVVHEFERNREAKIQDALRHLREQRLNLQFPAICKGYDEYNELRRLQREYEAQHTALLNRLNESVRAETLHADEVISELFGAATVLPTTDDLVALARRRSELGNPPGKQGSIGDAVNWEALLVEVPKGEALFFVTQDKDYLSPLHDQAFNAFLLSEWRHKKAADLSFYSRLSTFFKEHFPKIQLASEAEKEMQIADLARSSNFSMTHNLIAKLSQHAEFSTAQAADIVSAALSNNQVTWIATDEDVRTFLAGIVSRYGETLPEDTRKKLEDLLLLQKPVAN